MRTGENTRQGQVSGREREEESATRGGQGRIHGADRSAGGEKREREVRDMAKTGENTRGGQVSGRREKGGVRGVAKTGENTPQGQVSTHHRDRSAANEEGEKGHATPKRQVTPATPRRRRRRRRKSAIHRARAKPQQIVATRLLCCVQSPVESRSYANDRDGPECGEEGGAGRASALRRGGDCRGGTGRLRRIA